MIVKAWLPVVRELSARGIDPILQVYALSHLDVVVGAGEMLVGRFQHAIETVADATGTPLLELQRRAVERAATASSAETLIAALNDLRPTLESLPGVTSVGKVRLKDAQQVAVGVRSFATTRAIRLTTGSSPQTDWLRVLQALREKGVTDELVLLFVAHRCRLRLASGLAIEPLDEDTLYQTVGAAVGRDATDLKQQLFFRMANAGGALTPNAVTLSHDARALAAGIEGVVALEEVPLVAAAIQGPPITGEPPAAPWEAFPEPPSSMRWRMGAGEDVMTDWLADWRAMDAAARQAYLANHPMPDEWRDWLRLAQA
jgi:hypothetical protein